MGRYRRVSAWVLGSAAGLLLLVFGAAFLLEEPVRRRMERGMNAALRGYSVTLPELDLHPIGFSVTLRGLTLRQDAHPDPPVARFPRLTASIHWREILFRRLVAEFELERPRLYVNLQQLRKEDEDETPVAKRGWQAAVKQIYPFEINRLEVRHGELVYMDADIERPLRVSDLELAATNIRNIQSPQDPYPSPIRLTGVVFEKGRCDVRGRANFLSEPHPGIKADLSLTEIPLGPFRPVLARANLRLRGGVFSSSGAIEYAAKEKFAWVRKVLVTGLALDYVHRSETAAAERRRAEQAKEAARAALEESTLRVRIDDLKIASGEVGWVNEAKEPAYRVYLSAADLALSGFSTKGGKEPARATLTGRFMGSGETTAAVAFQPSSEGVNFDMDLRVVGTELPPMNDLLRAHAGVDVIAGRFSLYSEVAVHEGRIRGYVKPLFEGLNVYDPKQERGKGPLRKAKEAVVGALGQLLKNRREEVATVADLSGPVEDPKTSTLQVALNLVRNAFFDAILPGFRREAGLREQR